MSPPASGRSPAPGVAKTGTPRVIIYLWSLMPLGLVGGVVTLVLIIGIYQRIQAANEHAQQFDSTLVNIVTDISSKLDENRSEFEHVFNLDEAYSPDGTPLKAIDSQLGQMQELILESVGNLDELPRVDTSALHDLHARCATWRADRDRLNVLYNHARQQTEAAIAQLSGQLSSEEGKRRLHAIMAVKKLREASAQEIKPLLESTLNGSGIGSRLSMNRAELSKLALICYRLASEHRRDMLVSIRDNEILPSLARLRGELAELQSPEIQQSIDMIEEMVFGVSGAPATGSAPPVADGHGTGLYEIKSRLLASEAEAKALRKQTSRTLKELDRAVDSQAHAASLLHEVIAEFASRSLRTGGVTIIGAGLILYAILGGMTYKITRRVQRFVSDLNDSHEALELANGETLHANLELKATLEERDRLQTQLLQAQKLESIGQLAAGIAHEINTPMQYASDNIRFVQSEFKSVLETLQAYADELNPESPGKEWRARVDDVRQKLSALDAEFLVEEIPSALDQSIEGLERISEIVLAMKEFSHPGAQTLSPTDLNHAIESTVTVCQNRWKEMAELEMDLAPDMPMVPCHAAEFNQVILNLVVNASDAIMDNKQRDGGKPQGKIRISTRLKGDMVEIRVSDNGGGIPDHIRDKIFDPFFTTKDVGKGTGQGLAISHDVIVNKHHGELLCESTPGEGTTFIVRMPVALGDQPAQPVNAAA